MINKVISTIERYQMLKNGTTVIVAVSGGADSMALLSVLNTLKDKYNLKLIAAHVNHMLRGVESDRDENFVKDYCKEKFIKLSVLKVDINTLASSSGEGVEQCGRRVRYEFFNSLDTSAVIATAHTLSDSIETVIFNLARGSALKGICGIPAVRDLIIRPLIECSRIEIEEYCSTNKMSFLTDSTNMNDDYTRNHIRLNIIPQLSRINPRYQDAFLRCSESISNDEDLLNSLSIKLLDSISMEGCYKSDLLLTSHPSLRKRVLARILHMNTGVSPENKHIDALDNLLKNGGKVQVHNGVMVEVSNGIITFPPKSYDNKPWSHDLSEGTIKTQEKVINIKIVNRKDLEKIQNIHISMLDYSVDYDKIIDNAVVRSRREGDNIRLSKRRCTKSIKKLFWEASVPIHERNNVVILADKAGVLWVEGFGASERCEISDQTEQILLIDIRRA